MQMGIHRTQSHASIHSLASKPLHTALHQKDREMASTSSPNTNPHHVRSISLPSRSHPLSLRAEEGLHKLKTWTTSSLLQASSPTAELLCVGLQALGEMYGCVEELLLLPHTQGALARHQHEKWAAEELEYSLRLLDACGTTRDAILAMKEQAQGLQSALRTRRSGGDPIVESKARAFLQSRKKAHRDSSGCLKTLNQMEAGHLPVYPISDEDPHLSSLALRALTDLRGITIVIFRSISSFMSRAKPRRWRLATSKTSEGSEQSTGEIDEAEASLRSIRGKHSGKDAGFEKVVVEEAQKRLRRLEVGMGSLETGLDSMFRRLIQNRVTLLNIFSLQ